MRDLPSVIVTIVGAIGYPFYLPDFWKLSVRSNLKTLCIFLTRSMLAWSMEERTQPRFNQIKPRVGKRKSRLCPSNCSCRKRTSRDATSLLNEALLLGSVNPFLSSYFISVEASCVPHLANVLCFCRLLVRRPLYARGG